MLLPSEERGQLGVALACLQVGLVRKLAGDCPWRAWGIVVYRGVEMFKWARSLLACEARPLDVLEQWATREYEFGTTV